MEIDHLRDFNLNAMWVYQKVSPSWIWLCLVQPTGRFCSEIWDLDLLWLIHHWNCRYSLFWATAICLLSTYTYISYRIKFAIYDVIMTCVSLFIIYHINHIQLQYPWANGWVRLVGIGNILMKHQPVDQSLAVSGQTAGVGSAVWRAAWWKTVMHRNAPAWLGMFFFPRS